MKRLTPIIALIAVLLTGLLAAGSAFARKGPGGPGGHDGPRAEFNLRMLERAAGQLGLDDATLDRIKDRVYQAEKKGIDLRAKLELAKLELRRTLDADAPPKDEAMKRIAEVGRLETELRQHQIGLMLDVKAMLTPEQRQMLEKMRGERAGRGKVGKRGKRGKRGRGMGPPDAPAPPAPPGE